MSKIKCLISALLIIFLGNIYIFSQDSNYDRVMNRIPNNQLTNHLPGEVVNQMETELKKGFSQLSNDFKYNCYLPEPERGHYKNSTGYYSDVDALTFMNITANGKGYIYAKAYLPPPVPPPPKHKDTCTGVFKVRITLNNSIWNRGFDKPKHYEKSLTVRNRPGKNEKDADIPIDYKLNNDFDNPYLVKYPFFTISSNFYSTDHDKYWKKEINKDHGKNTLKYKKKGSNSSVYLANSPEPGIISESTMPGDFFHSQNFSLMRMKNTYNVKVLVAALFRADDNTLLKVKTEIMPDSSGLYYIEVSPLDLGIRTGQMMDEGEYFIVLGAVDQFNKMYLFEAEKFIIDQNEPVVTPVLGNDFLNSNFAISQANPVIMQWDNIEDNFTDYQTEADFIYVQVEDETFNDTNYYPITDPRYNSLFAIEDKQIKMVKKGELKFKKVIVKDKADNYFVVSENKNFLFNNIPPVISCSSQNKVYTSADDVLFEVSDITSLLKINQLRVKFPAENFEQIIPGNLPVSMDSNTFNLKILSKLDIQTEKDFVLGQYSLRNGYYYLNENISASDEKLLRDMLIKIDYLEYQTIDNISVPLALLKNKRGEFQIILEVEDIAGNQNEIDNRIFNLLIGDGDPAVLIKLNEQILDDTENQEYNLLQTLKIENNDPSITQFDLIVNSIDLGDSSNNKNQSAIQQEIFETSLVTDPGVNKERLTITIKLYETSGKTYLIERDITLYNDTQAPVVNITTTGTEGFTIDIVDDSLIELAALKLQDLSTDNSIPLDWKPVPEKVNATWNYNNWQDIGNNIQELDTYVTLLPGTAGCIYVVDQWGNSNELNLAAATFQNNHLAGGYDFIIDNKQDLIDYSYEVYGNVLIRTDLTIDNGETFTINSNSTKPTIVYCDSTNPGHPLAIENNGIIRFDTTNNTISFAGAGTLNEQYKWFGFKNLTGEFQFNGNNVITFTGAVAPLSYLNPAMNISLENFSFKNCLTAIHFIDDAAAYNTLTLDNCSFNNLVYGIKFEIVPYTVLGDFNNYLFRNNCTFTDISRAQVYWQSGDVE